MVDIHSVGQIESKRKKCETGNYSRSSLAAVLRKIGSFSPIVAKPILMSVRLLVAAVR